MAKEQKMTYFQCIKLLEACIKSGVLASDPDDANRLLVYRGAGKTAPEGWYSEPVMSVAQELLLHTEGQELLVKELKKGCHIRMYGKPRMRIPGSFRPNLRRNDHD